MTEYNVYIVDLRSNKAAYLYTTLADNPVDAAKEIDAEFYGEATGLKETTFHVIPTEDDDRSRDELIFDYIIEADDDTGATSSQ